MSRKQVPFAHRDISSLAKFLRNNLSISHGRPPKHTEVLNALAQKRGFSKPRGFRFVGQGTGGAAPIDRVGNRPW